MKIHAEPLTHDRMQQLSPWLLAGTLDSAERALVESHLLACAQCRADLEWQRKLRRAAPPPDAACDADRAFAQLAPRLQPHRPRNVVPAWWRRICTGSGAWLRWTAAVQLAAIGVLAVLLVRPGQDAGYRALGAAAPAAGQLVVMFSPGTTEREIRRILQASGARLADGPTVTGAYVVSLPAPRDPAALARLRAEPAVTLAQPLGAGSPP
jgi:hypothetical protein